MKTNAKDFLGKEVEVIIDRLLRVATVHMIHGRPTAKINHGVVKPVRT